MQRFYGSQVPGTAMSTFGAGLKYLYLACFSRPAAERAIYRAIRRHRVQRIVEIGIGAGQRARRMIRLAQQCSPGHKIHYTGIDLFEDRDPADNAGLSLKAAYRALKPTAARIRLTPGNGDSALPRIANELVGTDLLIVSAGNMQQPVSTAWRYVPRMLHAKSLLFVERNSGETQTFEVLTATEVSRLIFEQPLRKAA
jgi:hypothetical protein